MATTGLFGVSVLPPSGVQSADARIVYGAGDCAFWIDPSDQTTLTNGSSSSKVIAVTEKVSSRVFRYASKSGASYLTAPPNDNVDALSFKKPALIVEDSWFYSDSNGVDAGPVTIANADGEFVYLAVVRLEPNPTVGLSKPILIFGGKDYIQGKNEPGSPSNAFTLQQLPVVGNTQATKLRFLSANGHSDFTLDCDISQNADILLRVTVLKEPSYTIFRLHINGVLAYENTSVTNYQFSSIQICGFGIDTSVGTGSSVFGEIIAYRGRVDAAYLSELEGLLYAKWIKPYVAVTLGNPNTTIGVANATFVGDMSANNVATITLHIPVQDIPANWQVVLISSPGTYTTWRLTGTMPASLTDFDVILTAKNADGDVTIVKTITLSTTASGTIPTEKALYESLGELAAWLDTSETSTLTVDTMSGRVSAIRERQTTARFLVESSETPSRDSSTFSSTALAFSLPTESTSGQPYSIRLDLDNCPDFRKIDPASYLINNSGALANSPRSNGLVVSNSDGEYTAIFVGAYNAKAAGLPEGQMFIGSDFPYEQSPEYYVQRFGLTTGTVRSDPLTMLAQDAGIVDVTERADGSLVYNPRNVQATYDNLEVGTKFIAIWRKKSGSAPEMLLSTVGQAEVMQSGTAGAWSAPLQKFSRIFGTHSIGSFAELLMYSTPLTDIAVTSLVAHLTNKWFANAAVPPSFSALSNYSEYAGVHFSATVSISNGTSDIIDHVTISASAGTDWAIVVDGADPNLFHITGLMPVTPQAITLTLGATQSFERGTSTYTLQALGIPSGPDIGTLSPLSGAVNTAYLGQVTIQSAETVWMEATGGSGWQIAPSESGSSTYNVTGSLPSVVTTITLTIRGTRTVHTVDGDILTESARTFQLNVIKPGVIQATQYPLDLTAELQSNRVSEVQTLTADNGVRRQMIVPALAPFYMHRMKVETQDLVGGVWVEATPFVDYQPFCEFAQLTQAAAYPLYGAITFNNTSFEGNVRLTYQTLGGNFVLDRKLVLERLARVVWNQREINWSQVIDLPSVYPSDTHDHDVDADLIGLKPFKDAIVDALSGFVANSLSADVRNMAAHILDQDNPHHLTAGDVNLQNVPNYGVATDTEARTSTNNTKLLTPRGAAQAALQHIVVATTTTLGKVMLNQGTLPSDVNNSSKALTAAGLVRMMTDGSGNELQVAFASGDAAVQITPWPVSFPRYWRGIRYATMDAFMFALRNYMDCETLVLDSSAGIVYIPRGLPIPSLVTTATAGSYTLREATTEDWTEAPMRIPNV